MEADLSEGIKNKLIKTTHDATKTWNEPEGELSSREDYYVTLERRAGVEGVWEKIVLHDNVRYVDSSDNLTEVSSANYESVAATGTVPAYTKVKVEKDKQHIRFVDLPYCDNKGAPYQYRVAEVGVGSQSIEAMHTYLFLVPGTEATDEDYSYVRIVRRGSKNYYVNYNYDSTDTHSENMDYDYGNISTTDITNEIITNSVSFSHIKVSKEWKDENNLYGKRPEKITYRLTRTENGTIDNDFRSDKTVGEAQNWSCTWDQLAAFASDGGRFEYYVSELPVAGYVTTDVQDSTKDSTGEITKTITFTNTHQPDKKTLTAEKLWNDYSDLYKLRPTNVTYELYCKYDTYTYTDTKDDNNNPVSRAYTKSSVGYNGPVYDTKGTDETTDDVKSEVYKAMESAFTADSRILNPSVFKVTMDIHNQDGSDTNKWKTTFAELPAWINPSADGQFNGKSVEVTYYIVETFTIGDSVYKKVYDCEASNKYGSASENIPGTSKDTWVFEKGNVYSSEYTPVNSVYTVPAAIAVDGKLRVMIRDLPNADANGNVYTYTVTETDSSGNTISPSTHSLSCEISKFTEKDSNGVVKSKQKQERIDLLITAQNVSSSYIYFKVNSTKTIVNKVFLKDDNFAVATLNGNEAARNNTTNIIKFKAASAGDVSMTITGLPKQDKNGDLYTYYAEEYDNDSNEAVALSLGTGKDIVVSSDFNGSDKVNLTITKHGATINNFIYYKLGRSTSHLDNTNSDLDSKKANPFFICAVDDASVEYVDDLTSDNYGNTVLVENKIICLTASSSTASIVISGLPKKDPFGYDYIYSVEEYNGYSPSATANASTSMTTSSTDNPSDSTKVNITVTKSGVSADQKIYFRLKRRIDYSVMNNLGIPTVLRSAENITETASILNTLGTRNITVALDWNDNGYMAIPANIADSNYTADKNNKLHYNTEIKLSCNSLPVKDNTDPNKKYSETKSISVKNKEGSHTDYVTKYGVVFTNLPKYNSDGTVFEYSIEQKIKSGDLTNYDYNEQVVNAYDDIVTRSTGANADSKVLSDNSRHLGTDIAESKTGATTLLSVADGSGTEGRKYNYASSYTSYTDNIDGADYVTQYNIKNTLPLTAVEVKKHWVDQNNKFLLRPDVPDSNKPADPLALELKTKSLATTELTDESKTGPSTEGWNLPYYKVNNYPTEENDGITWTYKYEKLLKYDDLNKPYIFRIEETFTSPATHYNAYKYPVYEVPEDNTHTKKQVVKNIEDNNPAENATTQLEWDGTNSLEEHFDIINELDTRDIIVTKEWDDNGYGGNNYDIPAKLHYKTAITLEGKNLTVRKTSGTGTDPHSETKYLDIADISAGKGVIFKGLPKYDINGKVITYKVSEKLDTDNNHTTLSTDKAVPGVSDGWTNYCDKVEDPQNSGTEIDYTDSAIETGTNVEFVKTTNSTDRCYGYKGSAIKYIKTEPGDNSVTNRIINRYHITDELPLTALKVNKHWDDQDDIFGLRPSNVKDKNKDATTTDAIDLTLSRKIASASDYTDLVSADSTITTNFEDWYTTTALDNSTANEWTFEYQKLLKYDADNNAYHFKITETQDSNDHVNAYKPPRYCAVSDYDTTSDKAGTKQTITTPDVNNSGATQYDWDGTHPLVDEFEITNKLDTRDIVVAKKWDDNEYTGSTPSTSDLHYNIDVTLYCTNLDCTVSGRNDNGKYQEIRMIPEQTNSVENGVVFRDLPRFDKNGTEYVYSVGEAVANNNTNSVSDDTVTANFGNYSSVSVTYHTTSATTTVNTDIWEKTKPVEFTFTVDSRKYGYNGSCKLYKASSENTMDFCEITNELPVAEFDAKLYWADDNNRDGKRLDNADIVLSREVLRERENRTVTPPTDWDYIYFTDPHDSGGTWVNGNDPDPSAMMMILKGDGVADKTITAVGSFKNDITSTQESTYLQNVYKFPVPSDIASYTKVVFTNGTMSTVEIDLNDSYRHGYGFWPSNNSGNAADIYNIGGAWKQADGVYPGSAQSYQTDGRKIYFEMNLTSDIIWDDPHVYFFDSENHDVGTGWYGYIPTYVETNAQGNKVYSIEVPNNAVKFVLNNGYNQKKQTTNTTIDRGKTYVFKKTNESYGMDGGMYILESTGSGEGILESVEPLVKVAADYHGVPTTNEYKDLDYWYTNFGQQILYNEDNIPYTYRISELDTHNTPTKLTTKGYTYKYSHAITMDKTSTDPFDPEIREITATESLWIIEHEELTAPETEYIAASGTEPAKVTFSVQNEYTPIKRKIKIIKNWAGDSSYSAYTRPDSMSFTVTYEDQNQTGHSDPYTVSSSDSWRKETNEYYVYRNTTGTPVLPGSSEKKSYTVTETPHAGYTVSGDSGNSFSLDDNDNAATERKITNTLNTGSIKITKNWNDNGYSGTSPTKAQLHYNVTAYLACTDLNYTHNETISTGANDSGSVTVNNLPIYKSDGTTKFSYAVTETPIKQYGYEVTYSTNCSGLNADSTTIPEAVITNTLPVTSVSVTKNWTDSSNTHALRPDNINLNLYRADSALDRDAASGWGQVTDHQLSGSGDTWTYTFEKLLQYNSSNQPYYFKVNEDAVSAYNTTYSQTNGVLPETDLGVTNTLITGKVTLTKKWNDNGYGTSLHYPVQMEIVKDVDSTKVPKQIRFEGTVTTGDSTTGSQVINDVPIYDKTGTAITYTAKELNQQYGYVADAATKDLTVTAPDASGNIGTVGFTNTLPVTYLKVNKTYVDDDDYHKYATNEDRKITLDITRSYTDSNDTVQQDTAFNSASGNSGIEVNYAASDMHYISSSPLLVYNTDNKLYTYTVTEQALTGYNTTYSVGGSDGVNSVTAASSTPASPQEINVTNTQITGNATFNKIDGTYKAHYNQSGFYYEDKVIEGAKFELYRKTGDVRCNVKQSVDSGSNLIPGKYEFSATAISGTTTTELVTNSEGNIIITGLPLNTYYLKETEAPTGYELNTSNIEFTVDVDNLEISQQIEDTEKANNLELTKVDGASDPESPTPITSSKATYLLLRMIHKTANINATYRALSDSEYLTAAKAALAGNNRSDFWNSSWGNGMEGPYQTDGSGKITVKNVDFGTYFFYEIQSPVGYEIKNTVSDKFNDDQSGRPADKLMVIESGHGGQMVRRNYEDPRKDASVKIFKHDEYNNPLNDAEFELYYDPPKHESDVYSDNDYIFFTDNSFHGSWTDANGKWGSVYARFFDDSDSPLGDSFLLNSYWLNDTRDQNEFQKVYRVKYPPNATKVIFSDGNTKKTDKITFGKGEGYYKTGYVNFLYTVNSWNHGPNTTDKYQTYGEFIRIKYDSDIMGNDKSWDDLHICFFDENDNAINQTYPGYILDDLINSEYYQIEIPIGARKFSLNNGNKNNLGVHYSVTNKIPLAPYTGYKLVYNSSGYDVKVYAKNLDTDSSAQDLNEDPQTSDKFIKPVHIATVVTGYDGLTKSIKWLKPNDGDNVGDSVDAEYLANDKTNLNAPGITDIKVVKWGDYYFKETKAPVGHTIDPGNEKIDFIINSTEADKTVNIYYAGDTRKKGSVKLTKTAKEPSGTTAIGAKLPGAKFNLFDSSNNKLAVTENSTGNYTVASSGTYYDMTTDSNGEIFIDGIDWGNYYLKEENAPIGYEVNNQNIDFSVGMNNCEVVQQLICADPAQKAKLKITKTITERIDAWGDPTFIFKIRQTKHYVNGTLTNVAEANQIVLTKSVTLTSGDTGFIDYFDIEPGTYEITEVNVSRYKFKTLGKSDEQNIANWSTNNDKASFDISPNGKITVNYTNEVEYYDKFSHVDTEINHFGGYKGIRVEYKDLIGVGTDPAVIAKSLLKYYKINSDGSETEITDAAQKNALKISYVSQTGDDTQFSTDFSDDSANNQIMIANPSRYTSGVYRLKATNTDGFECEFNISFVPKDSTPKAYEKTFVFKADDRNMTYFNDGGTKTSQYAFTFAMVSDGGSGYKVYSVKHNGTVIAEGNNIAATMETKLNQMQSALTPNEAYNSKKEFDYWLKDSDQYSPITYDALKTIAETNSPPDSVEYKAVLKDKSSS